MSTHWVTLSLCKVEPCNNHVRAKLSWAKVRLVFSMVRAGAALQGQSAMTGSG